jgi:hypothetical protein
MDGKKIELLENGKQEMQKDSPQEPTLMQD